jgi:hypothetical protein
MRAGERYNSAMDSTLTHYAATIDQLLLQYESLWRPLPFASQSEPEWPPHYPRLAAFLLTLSDDKVQQLQGDDTLLLSTLGDHFSAAKTIRSLLETLAPEGPSKANINEPPSGVSGRKWQQITMFLESQENYATPFIEWCAGKGFLGEALCERGAGEVLSLEIQSALVDSGNCRAQQRAQPRRLMQCDVLQDELSDYLHANQHLMALHACGGLHQRMLSQAVEFGCEALSLSPCCYHRYTDHYRPLSSFFRNSPLRLSNDDLRLAVRQTNTARQGETLARRTLQAWQLSILHLLQQQGLTPPSGLPSLPMSAVKKGFLSVAQELADRKSLPLNLPDDPDSAIAYGWQQLHRIERFGLLSMCFRRLMELRCVLDCQLYLEENGYRTSLHTFCAPSLTPRNLLLKAQRAG